MTSEEADHDIEETVVTRLKDEYEAPGWDIGERF
jgi:hypothetical protein